MAQVRHGEPDGRRRARAAKRAAGPGALAASAGIPPVITRRIVNGEPLGLSADDGFEAALRFSEGGPGRMTLSVVSAPTPETIAELGSAWGLHPVLVEDLLHAGQRPKLERYRDTLFLVVRSARYIDESEEVEFSEFHLLMRPGALAVVCQDGRLIDGTVVSAGPTATGAAGAAGAARAAGAAGAAGAARAAGAAGSPGAATPDDAPFGPGTPFSAEAPLFANRALLRLGPEAMVYQLLDAIVDGYFPVLDGLQTDKEQIERQVFSGDAAAAERIYRLSQEVIDLLHASTALSRVLQSLHRGADKYDMPDELQAYLQDVSDHLTRVISETTELRDALSQILNVNATLVAQRQNEDMKKISGWAAILFAPTLVGAIYGMNFDVMPELHWAYGYPLAIGAMVGLGAALYGVFKWKKWM